MTDLQTLRRIAEGAISLLEIDSCWCSSLPRDEKCDAHKHAEVLRDMNNKLLRVVECAEKMRNCHPWDWKDAHKTFDTALADLQEKK